MKKLLFFLLSFITLFYSCDMPTSQQANSDSGVTKASVKVATDTNGNTIEQKNIVERLKRDNEKGSIKHLYIISSFSGDVLQYSTVAGKVTSGNKRLSPKTVEFAVGLSATNVYVNKVTLDNTSYATKEVLSDDGTYGESANYIYWFDAQSNYHQYFPAGGTYIHISDKPLRIKKSNFTLELE